MNKVNSISLDDMDDLPGPIGGGAHDTKHKAMHYTPGYVSDGMSSNLGVGPMSDHTDEGTRRGGGRFSDGLTKFTQVLGGRNFAGGGSSRSLLLAAIFGFILLFAGLYMYLGEEYFTGILDSAHSLNNEGEPPAEAPMDELAPQIQPKPEAAVDAPPPVPVSEEIAGNPYWRLPNPSPPLIENLPAAAQQQTDSWRAGLSHPFAYQRFKTAADLRKARVDGALSLLYESLAQGKFWTRMEALAGIAENGVAIDNESMKTAIGDARSDLVRNYFRRFRTDYTEATAHIMRQALRVVDEKARFIILSNLAKRRGEVNDQYLYAAAQNETDPKIKAMVQALLERQPIPQAFVILHDKALTGEIVNVLPKGKPGDIKAEKIPANMNVEEVYFINDEPEAPPTPAAEAPKEEVKEAVDDGFDDLQHSEQESDEEENAASESNSAAP